MRVSGQAAIGGNKRAVNIPEEDWVRVPNAHESIISAEQFERVQALRAKFTRNKKDTQVRANAQKSPTIVGKVVCGHCNRVMRLISSRPFFRCPSVKQMTKQGCYEERVYLSDIEEALLAAVKAEVQKVLELRGDEQKIQHKRTQGLSERESLLSEVKKLTTSVSLLEKQNLALYEKFVEGRVSKDAYVSAKAENIANMESMQTQIAGLNQKLTALECTEVLQHRNKDESALQRILTATEVTGEVLALLDRMIIYNDKRIEIRFAFGDSQATNENRKED
jgi:hypothetical protein